MNCTLRTRWAATAAVAAALALGPGARADDPKAPPAGEAPRKDVRPVSSDEAARNAIERFEMDFRSADEGRRMNAIESLGRTKNDLVTKKLGSLLQNASPDVRSAAALVLDGQYQNVPLAGEFLRKAIAREEEVDVLLSEVLTLGRVLYCDAIPEMGELLTKNDNVWVKIEVLKAFGKMKDRRALLPILDLWLVNPQGYDWEGGEVKYDSGAPGDHDQKEAERRYKEKYGNQQRHGAPPTMLKTYIQAIVEAVEKICGEKLSNPTELMGWLVLHEAELPFKIPPKVKSTFKEWQDRSEKKKKK